MKAPYYNELKSHRGIKLGNFPQPAISNNEVLVPLKAFSLNHLDVLVMKGEHTVQLPLLQNKRLEHRPMILPFIMEV
jgi:NADPH:quinone reductase-like Zn-dependent oxidoreductase